MNKHAIILHLYYEDLWSEFYSALEEIIKRPDVDFYVTLTKDDATKLNKIKSVTDNVFVLENRGLDVGPFLFVLDKIKDKNYQTITKIHSKKSLNSIKNREPENYGEEWRVRSYYPLLHLFDKLTQKISVDSMTIIGAQRAYMDFNGDRENISYHYKTLKKTEKKLGISLKESKIKDYTLFGNNGAFFSGTMFMTSHDYLKRLFKNANLEKLRKGMPIGYCTDSDAHSIERIFGYFMETIEGNLLIINERSVVTNEDPSILYSLKLTFC
jgi:lipopolysaccharide biosynthesis protein